MKAKYGLALLGLVIAAAAVWLLTRPAPLANMRHACPQPESGVSIVTFSGQAGEQFQFSMSSNITSGELDLSLCDQAGNVVKPWDKFSGRNMRKSNPAGTHFVRPGRVCAVKIDGMEIFDCNSSRFALY